MKRRWSLLFVFIFLFAFLVPVYAQDDIGALKEEMRNLQEKIESLQKKIEDLEAQQRKTVEVPGAPLEMLSDLGDEMEIGGKVEIRYVNVQEDWDHPAETAGHADNPSDPRGRFELDEVELEFELEPAENIEFEFEVEFKEIDEVEIDEAHITFEEILPLEGEICAGLRDRFIEETFETYTATSPLAKTAFWKDPDIGIWYEGKYDPFYWHVSLTNGLGLKAAPIGADSADRDVLLQDDDYYKDRNENKEVGLGLGYQNALDGMGSIDLLGFAYIGKLQAAGEEDDDHRNFGLGMLRGDYEEEYLNADGVFPDYPGGSTEDIQRRYGINAAYTKDALEVYVQYIRADDGVLRRHAWLIQPSYKFDMDFKYLKAVQPLFRYGQYLINQPHRVGYPLTWDRSRYTFALINCIRENIFFNIEYNFNLEDTGADNIRNDEFLAQLEYEF